jgi:hypothetical protein
VDANRLALANVQAAWDVNDVRTAAGSSPQRCEQYEFLGGAFTDDLRSGRLLSWHFAAMRGSYSRTVGPYPPGKRISALTPGVVRITAFWFQLPAASQEKPDEANFDFPRSNNSSRPSAWL